MRIKSANTKYDIHPLIKERWSPRAFRSQVPPKEEVLRLLEAAQWAPSSYNEQPWRFIIGVRHEGDSYDRVYSCLNEFNQKWARNAPVLMLVVAKKTFSKNGKPNKHNKYDCGAAMANLCLQATADNLHVHQMAGILPDKAADLFDVPDDFEVITGAAIGYLGDAGVLADDQKKSEQAERSRKSLHELAFIGQWGEGFE